jgi:hypothetical protein
MVPGSDLCPGIEDPGLVDSGAGFVERRGDVEAFVFQVVGACELTEMNLARSNFSANTVEDTMVSIGTIHVQLIGNYVKRVSTDLNSSLDN